MKRSYALLLALCMVLTIAVSAVDEVPFPDVPAGAPYAEAVQWAAEHGYVNGYRDGRFGVADNVTRAQLSAILYRAAGSPAASGTTRFPDVAAGAYYADAVSWAAAGGLIGGYDDGRFGVGDPVTRQQAAAILWRWAGTPNASAADHPDESAIAAYARTAVDWVCSNDIMAVRSDGRFDPTAPATRVEVVSALYQYMALPSHREDTPSGPDGSHVLVAYFSATNNTENIADHLQAVLHADLYEIVPETPYTSADLNYNDANSRANREQNDDDARPAISGPVKDLTNYDTVFLGYPIWHGQAPKIVRTFLESGDLAGKTIVPFCTSGSSPIGSSAAALHALAPSARWLDGRRFSGSASQDAVASWVNGLGLTEETANTAEGTVSTLDITVNGTTLTAALADDPSARALAALLESGPRTIEMSDYGSMEKVGPLGQSLPTNDEQISTQAGDLILYQGDRFVIYYAPNSWSFTRLGRIDNVSAAELRNILGSGDVSVTLSLR